MAWDDELTRLVQERGPALVGCAYLLTGSLPAAEDLVQEAVLRTFTRRRAGSGQTWLEAYVRRVILNVYLDEYRGRRRWWHAAPVLADDRAVASPDASVPEQVDVVAALALLSPRERACVVLRFYEDLTVADTAERLGLSVGAVKRYLFDANRRLGPVLAPGYALRTEDVTPLTTTRKAGR